MNKIERIYIPTLGRVDNQITYDNMPDWVKGITYLVVQPHEFDSMQEKYPDANLLRLPEDDYGILLTRKWIVEHAGDVLYSMMDDDVTFWIRNVDRKTLKKNAEKSKVPFTEKHWGEMLSWASDKLCGEYTIAGCTLKHAFPRPTEEIEFPNICQVFFINGFKIDRNRLEWVYKWSEDVHFLIQIVELGGKTVSSDRFLFVSKPAAPGGCRQEGRFTDNNHEEMVKLVERYPNYMKFKDGQYTTFTKDYAVQKYSIRYKKAYRVALNKTKFWDV